MERLPEALTLWDGLSGSEITLINLSENHTFRIDTPDERRYVLRVHRYGYHSRGAIESEIAWMQALRRDAGLFTPQPIAGRDGIPVQEAPFLSATDLRHMVLFAFEEGSEPPMGDGLIRVFSQLGGLAAQCHKHVERWTPPPGFQRQAWTAESILDADAVWGDWRAAPGVGGAVRRALDAVDLHLRTLLSAYGKDDRRFGLIHADMRLANLLVAVGVTRLIDFDDCGFSWFGYDFAAAVSFFEDSPIVPDLRSAWLAGYRRHRNFSAEDEGMLDAMVMLRRMALLAWIGTHQEADLAQELRACFAPATAELAERFLSSGTIDR